MWVGSIVATAVVVAAVTLTLSRMDVAPASRLELQISPPSGTSFTYNRETVRFAVSPDGQQLAFIAAGADGANRVWMRPLSSIVAPPVTGTDGAAVVFWSPDSRSIGFVTGDTMKRLELASGGAVTIRRVPDRIGLYGTWSRNGEILFATIAGDALYRVSTGAVTPPSWLRPEAARGEVQIKFPSFLPDGKRYLYLTRHRDGDSVLMLGESGKDPRVIPR